MKRLSALLAALGIAAAVIAPAPAEAFTTGTVDGAFTPYGSLIVAQSTPYCSGAYSCERVPNSTWPGQEVADAAQLAAWIEANPDAQLILTTSYGGEVAAQLQREYADGRRPVPARNLTFVNYGNPENHVGGWAYNAGANNGCNCGVGLPDQPAFPTVEVTAQYDPYADYPNNPDSPYYWLAVTNAFAGNFTGRHTTAYLGVDPFDPTLPRWTDPADGTVYVFLPTTGLPILFGLPNAALQEQIETAYIRPDYQPAAPAATATITTREVSTSVPTSTTSDPVPTALSAPVSPLHTTSVDTRDGLPNRHRPHDGTTRLPGADLADTTAPEPVHRGSTRGADSGEAGPTDRSRRAGLVPRPQRPAGEHRSARHDSLDRANSSRDALTSGNGEE